MSEGIGQMRVLIAGWLLLTLPVPYVFSADTTLTNSAKAGEWVVDELKSSEGEWHSYSSKLTPINNSGTGRVTESPGANITPSDEAEYFIDTKKPIITKISPSGNQIDSTSPQIIYEIDDGKEGSGLNYFGGESDSVTLEVKSPTPYGEKKIFFNDNGIKKLRLIITVDSHLLKNESHDIKITATDRVGNVATKTESFSGEEYKESFQLIDSIKNNPSFERDRGVYCRYKYPIDILGRVAYMENDAAIVTGKPDSVKKLDSVKITFTTGGAPVKDIIEGINFSIDGPAEYSNSDESTDEVKVITLKAKDSAKNGDIVTLTVTYPSEGEGDYNGQLSIQDDVTKVVNGGTVEDYSNEFDQTAGLNICPTRIRSAESLRCVNGEGTFGLSSVCSVRFGRPLFDKQGASILTEQDEGLPAVLTGETATKKYVFNILKSLPTPTGQFDYDNEKKELTYTIKSLSDSDLDTSRSTVEIGSNVGYTATKRVIKSGSDYKVIFSNVEEGDYDVRAVLTGFGFFDENGVKKNPYILEDSYEVKGEPPQIVNFTYDYSRSLLTFQVDDTGTPRDKLTGILNIEGKSYEVSFNKDGYSTFKYPQPLESSNILLSVSDLSQQKNEQILSVVGVKEFDAENADTETFSFSGGIPADSQGYVGQGPISGGTQLFIYCRPRRVSSSRSRASFGSSGSRSSRGGSGPVIGGVVSGVRRSARSPINSGSCSGNQGVNLNNYCSTSARRASARRSGGSRASRTVPRCSPPRRLDRFSPVISNFIVNPDSSNFTATISDSGGPLDNILVNYTVREDVSQNLIVNIRNAATSGSYDGQGNVAANYDFDPEREIVEVVLSARDSSGNSATARKKVLSPKSPPNIVFSHVAINDAVGSTLLFAEFQDRSGIDIPLTELSVDGTPCVSQLLSAGQGNSASYRDALKWVCRAQLDEGQHVFSAKGADGVGLVARAQYPFDINYKPTITSLVLNDVNPEETGVNVFSAEIVDLGKNVDVSGIELSIDGQLVPRDQYLFDSVSGQFDALGPIAISEGLHTAQLLVTDVSGNSDLRSLPFGRINNLVVNDPGTGDLQLDRVSVWELQNANGDGLINPGELVRLFPAFINTGVLPISNLTITTNINVLGANIESPTGNIATIEAGQSASLLSGFDLRIDADFLSREGLQEKTVPIEFIVTDESGHSWHFTSDILVREPRESFQAVTQPATNTGTAPVLSVTNVLPSLVLNTPPTITPPIFDVGGMNVAYTGTLDPADSTIESVTFSFDGGAAIEIVGGGGRLGGGFGGSGGSVSGNNYSFSALLGSGNHVVVVTFRTADGDVAVATDSFSF